MYKIDEIEVKEIIESYRLYNLIFDAYRLSEQNQKSSKMNYSRLSSFKRRAMIDEKWKRCR